MILCHEVRENKELLVKVLLFLEKEIFAEFDFLIFYFVDV